MHPATDAPRLPSCEGERPDLRAPGASFAALGRPLLAALLLGGIPLAAVRLLGARLYTVAEALAFLVLHNTTELFGIVVSMSIFGVGWFTDRLARDRHTLFLACVFLGIALLDVLHALSYPGMPDFFGPNDIVKASQYWLAARLFTAGSFLASAFVLPDAPARWLSRRSLLVPALGAPALAFTLVTFFPRAIPVTFDAGGLTPFKVVTEYAVVCLFLAAIPAYVRRARRTGDGLTRYYLIAFVLSAFGELSLTAYRSAFDTFNVLGHVYKLVAFCFVYRAVFVARVRAPYLGFAAKKVALEAEIQERRAAEASLRESEDSLKTTALYARSLIEASLDPLVTISPEGKVTDVNRATEEVTGVARDHLVGTDFADAFTEPELARAGYRRVLEQGFVRDYPLTIRHTSGSTVDVLYNATVYRDAAGRLQGVFAAARDVTERRRAEAARAHLAAIIESSSDAIIGKSLDGIVLSWNVGAERIYGYPAAEMIGQSIGVLVPPGLEGESTAMIDRIRRGEDVLHHETVRLRKDGRRIDVALTLSPIRSAAGEIVGVSTIARDVTERKRAEQELARLAAELERRVVERTGELGASNRELEAFVYSVSHDLRAPLRHIGGFIELLQRRTEGLDDQARHYAAVISQAAGAMGTMIDGLLAFSRMGRGELAKSRVDLEALVRDIARDLGPETEGRTVDWKVGTLPSVWADREMLRLVMVNLLSNAAKFTRTRPRAEIEVGCAPAGDRAETVIFVRDNGVGFDPRYADKLFKVFQRLHRAEDFEGTGIGLANVRRIVERHGGRVWAEGAPDRGATFFLSLPTLPGDPS